MERENRAQHSGMVYASCTLSSRLRKSSSFPILFIPFVAFRIPSPRDFQRDTPRMHAGQLRPRNLSTLKPILSQAKSVRLHFGTKIDNTIKISRDASELQPFIQKPLCFCQLEWCCYRQATHDNKQAPYATADAYIMPVMVTRWSFSFCGHWEVTFPAWEEAYKASSLTFQLTVVRRSQSRFLLYANKANT